MNVTELRDASLRVYQCETTNRCTAKCSYCPHPAHARRRGHMRIETFVEVLRVMQNQELSLHHFGEPLLNPHIVEMVDMATLAGVDVGFSTNGVLLTQSLLEALHAAGLKWLRLHCDPHGVRLSRYDVPEGLEFTEHRMLADIDAPQKDMVSFSGHLDMAPDRDHRRCSFLRDSWRVVLWNGDVALCCHDIEGTSDASLCSACNGYVFKGPRDWMNYDG